MNRFDDIDQELLDQFGEVAADAATKSFQFLKLVVPKPGSPPDWRAGDVITSDEEAIALADESVMGWVRFKNDRPVEEHWVRQLGNRRPARPNTFCDETRWELWKNNGKPKDPWTYQTRLPLKLTTGELAGKVVLFNGKDEGSRIAIADVQAAFVAKRRRPLIRFTSIKRDFESVFDPVLEIIRFTEDDSIIRGLNLAKDDATVVEPQATRKANGGGLGIKTDMDDDIPFAAEWR